MRWKERTAFEIESGKRPTCLRHNVGGCPRCSKDDRREEGQRRAANKGREEQERAVLALMPGTIRRPKVLQEK
jgi:hypothetical protein